MRKLLGIHIFSAILVGCNDTSLEKERENELLAKIDSLQAVADKMEKKGRMVAKAFKDVNIGSSVLSDLYNSNVFWKDFNETGFNECSSGCAETSKAARERCDALTNPEEKARCHEIRERAKITCDSTCVQQFMTKPLP